MDNLGSATSLAESVDNLLRRNEAALIMLDAALVAWHQVSLVDARTASNLLLDIRTLLTATEA